MSITILDVHSVVYGAHKGNPIYKCGFPVAGIAKVFGILNGLMGTILLKKNCIQSIKQIVFLIIQSMLR